MNVSAVRACPRATTETSAPPTAAPRRRARAELVVHDRERAARHGLHDGVACTTGDVCQGEPLRRHTRSPAATTTPARTTCDVGTGACVFARTSALHRRHVLHDERRLQRRCLRFADLRQCAPCQRCRPLAGCVAEPKPCQPRSARRQLLPGRPDDARQGRRELGQGVTAPIEPVRRSADHRRLHALHLDAGRRAPLSLLGAATRWGHARAAARAGSPRHAAGRQGLRLPRFEDPCRPTGSEDLAVAGVAGREGDRPPASPEPRTAVADERRCPSSCNSRAKAGVLRVRVHGCGR